MKPEMNPPATEVPICPRCGAPMVQRNSAHGSFWGCGTFPNCRATVGDPIPKGFPTMAPKPSPPHVDVREHVPHFAFSQPSVGRLSSKAPNLTTGGVKPFAGKEPEPPKYAPVERFQGSDEQKDIWAEMRNGSTHMVINAGPGTGKSTTTIIGCLNAPKTQRIMFVAFNKHIAAEANGKLAASGCNNVRACTQHSLGYSILRENFRTLGSPNENKMTEIFEALSPVPLYGKAEWRRKLNLAEKLSGYVKNYLLDYKSAGIREELERLADHHGLEMNGKFQDACDLVAPALDKCKELAPVSADFNDMIWLPVVLGLSAKAQVDMLIVDESQDLAPGQHALTFLGCPKGRIVVVGDFRQSIYSWRGADTNSIATLSKQLGATSRGVKEFPLTITRRCPKRHVEMAQTLYPDIKALPDAPDGEIFSMTRDAATNEMKPGDLVLCRVNKELITTAYALIKRGVRPQVKGRDIGKGLLALIDTLEKEFANGGYDPNDPERESEMKQMHGALSRYRFEQISKLSVLGDKAKGRIAAINDKCDCLLEFICNSKSITEMRSQIRNIFNDSDVNNAVVLGTIHRTKGLEAARVFVLAPELLPHPMAKKPHAVEEEKHLLWVAVTRAKFTKTEPGTIIFCGPIPPILNAVKKPERLVHAMGPTTDFSLERELKRQRMKHDPLTGTLWDEDVAPAGYPQDEEE